MNCMASVVKYILYFFNLIFVACGILLIVLGSLVLSNIGNIKTFSDAFETQTIPILIIVLGAVIFVISFFGCCGAIRENQCCMITYAVFMFVLFCLQMALTVWIFVKRQDFLNAMNDLVNEIWQKNDQANGYPMDTLQLTFDCCGLSNYKDYISIGQTVPNSCCGSVNNVCNAQVYVTKPGCRIIFNEFWSHNVDIIRFGGIAVALFELMVFAFACCLASSMRRPKTKIIAPL